MPEVKAWHAFRYRDLRFLLAYRLLGALAMGGFFSSLGWLVYDVTGQKTALGNLGLAEVVPALFMLFFGGHLADRGSRKILLVLSSGTVMTVLAIFAFAVFKNIHSLALIYGSVMVLGFASGVSSPAFTALEAAVVPVEESVAASGLIGSLSQIGMISGPAVALTVYHSFGPKGAFMLVAVLIALAHSLIYFVSKDKPAVVEEGKDEPLLQSIREGWNYVRRNQVLIGSMTLDLFAVLFAGAVALIPVFAKDILHIDAGQAGILASTTSAGAFTGMLLTTKFDPNRRAGRNLLIVVGGFGISLLVFALSKSFWLSACALFFSGVFDGVSMIIRRVIFRVIVPDHLRGRVGAVNMMFIGASNELGAAESGYAAQAFGTVPSVVMGALACLAVVGVGAVFGKSLREFEVVPGSKDSVEDLD